MGIELKKRFSNACFENKITKYNGMKSKQDLNVMIKKKIVKQGIRCLRDITEYDFVENVHITSI